MREDLKIAWRNLWRNRRRTIITSASVFFAVFFAVVMRSYQLGTYDHMISNFIESYSGYIQVQNINYLDNPTIDNSFGYRDSLSNAISAIDKVVSVSPHIESFALASSGALSKGVAILGIDPEKEKKFSNPVNKLVRYMITTETINKLKRSASFPENLLRNVENNLDRSYSSRGRLELEMGFTKHDNELYIPEIMKASEVRNGFLSEKDDGVLVSDRLADYIKVVIGDTVILMGQGYHGISAAGLFPVRGIIKMPSPEIDNRLIIMTLPAAQNFFDAEGKITSLSINLTNKTDKTIKKVSTKISLLLNNKNTIARSWKELNPVLVQQIQGDSETGMVMLGLLYFIIFFGIFGTVLMMIAERTREFGVLVAIGMQKKRLKRIITVEMILLGALGLISGLSVSTPVILYFHYFPIVLKGELGKMMEDYGWDAIMPTAWFGSYFYYQAVIVALMVLLATVYPLRKIGKLKEIEALRS